MLVFRGVLLRKHSSKITQIAPGKTRDRCFPSLFCSDLKDLKTWSKAFKPNGPRTFVIHQEEVQGLKRSAGYLYSVDLCLTQTYLQTTHHPPSHPSTHLFFHFPQGFPTPLRAQAATKALIRKAFSGYWIMPKEQKGVLNHRWSMGDTLFFMRIMACDMLLEENLVQPLFRPVLSKSRKQCREEVSQCHW